MDKLGLDEIANPDEVASLNEICKMHRFDKKTLMLVAFYRFCDRRLSESRFTTILDQSMGVLMQAVSIASRPVPDLSLSQYAERIISEEISVG